MNPTLKKQVSFDLIRYANCWEDADILLAGLCPEPGSKILSIGSAGDNSFSLLTSDPGLVVAIDINKVQLHLIELKKICIQNLSHHETLMFLGFLPSKTREKVFEEIKGHLSKDARLYWERNIKKIKAGIISQGKFEKYFQLFSNIILPMIHSKKTVEKLLSYKSSIEQTEFYNRSWNSRRWRLLFKIFFGKYVMGKFGRDPEFLREVKVPVGQYIFKKAEKHLRSISAQDNFILRYNLTGSFGNRLPHYLKEENFYKIKLNLHKFRIMEGYAEDAIKAYGTFKYMNLSNIFEYMDYELFKQTAEKLVSATEKGGRLAYWNLMVPRRISGVCSGKAEYLKDLSLELSGKDKGFFYNQFTVDQIK